MTNLADLAVPRPTGSGTLAGIHAMGGSVEGPLVDGVAEWNVAADPAAFATVLAAGAPLTARARGRHPRRHARGARRAGRRRTSRPRSTTRSGGTSPRSRALVAPPSGRDEAGTWKLDPAEPGRLVRTDEGPVRVSVELDGDSLEEEYARAFAPAG